MSAFGLNCDSDLISYHKNSSDCAAIKNVSIPAKTVPSFADEKRHANEYLLTYSRDENYSNSEQVKSKAPLRLPSMRKYQSEESKLRNSLTKKINLPLRLEDSDTNSYPLSITKNSNVNISSHSIRSSPRHKANINSKLQRTNTTKTMPNRTSFFKPRLNNKSESRPSGFKIVDNEDLEQEIEQQCESQRSFLNPENDVASNNNLLRRILTNNKIENQEESKLQQSFLSKHTIECESIVATQKQEEKEPFHSQLTFELEEQFQKGKKLRESLGIKKFLILPDDAFKSYWDIVIAILLMYTTIVTPFLLAFYDQENLGWTIVDSAVDIIFAIDIFLNFFSAYFDSEENLEINRLNISTTYLKGWFIIDFVSVIPISLILRSKQDFNSLARIARLPRLYRLVKMAKLVRMLKVVKERNVLIRYLNEIFKVTAGIERIIYIIFVFFLLCHITACLWFFLAKIDNFSPETWVARYGYVDSSILDCYLNGFYWIVTTITTVGFGDISPMTFNERIFGIVIMCIGVCAYSFAIGSLSSVLSNLDSRQAKLKEKLSMLEDMKKNYNLDTNFYMKLRGALKYDYRMKDHDKYDFLNELPPQLKQELSIIMHSQLIKKIPFFSNRPHKFITTITQYLKPFKIAKDEYIFKENDLAGEIYFLTKGSVRLVLDQYQDFPFFHLKEGNHFGELDLIECDDEQGILRNFTAKAVEDCELYVLSEQDFKLIMSEFSQIVTKLFDHADLKLNKLINLKKEAEQKIKQHKKTLKVPRTVITTNQLQKDIMSFPSQNSNLMNITKSNDFYARMILQMGEKLDLLSKNLGKISKTIKLNKPTRHTSSLSGFSSHSENSIIWTQINKNICTNSDNNPKNFNKIDTIEEVSQQCSSPSLMKGKSQTQLSKYMSVLETGSAMALSKKASKMKDKANKEGLDSNQKSFVNESQWESLNLNTSTNNSSSKHAHYSQQLPKFISKPSMTNLRENQI